MRVRSVTSLACIVLSSGAIVACGGSSGNGVASKSPDGIISAASHAIARAKSVHVSGSIVTSGVPLNLDLTLASGKGGRGQVSEAGLAFSIVEVGQTIYLHATPSFWQHFGSAALARVLTGRWLKAPATGQFASIASLTDMQRVLGTLLLRQGLLSKGATTTVRGQPVVTVRDEAEGGTLFYVATTGSPYPVEIKRQGAGRAQIFLDRFNQPVSLAPPANSVDVSQLG